MMRNTIKPANEGFVMRLCSASTAKSPSALMNLNHHGSNRLWWTGMDISFVVEDAQYVLVA